MRRALEVHAAGLVFAHNHPSGESQPSKYDIQITRELYWAGRTMGIRVLDHLIIGEGRYTSLADMGYLSRFQQDYENRSKGA